VYGFRAGLFFFGKTLSFLLEMLNIMHSVLIKRTDANETYHSH